MQAKMQYQLQLSVEYLVEVEGIHDMNSDIGMHACIVAQRKREAVYKYFCALALKTFLNCYTQ